MMYILIIMGIFLVWLIVEAQLFRVKHIKIKSKKVSSGINIVFISDIHYGKFYLFNRLEKIVNRINMLEPDIILVGGDLFENSKDSKVNLKKLEVLFFNIAKLKAKYGILAVLGNHDYYLGDDLEKLMLEFNKHNITLLKNDSNTLKIRNENIGVFGTDDFQEGKIHYDNYNLKEDIFRIIVSHNPDVFENIDLAFDLGLSGHTHGGQINLFGVFAPISESDYGQKYVKRMNKKGGTTIITSKGSGCSMLPFRFFSLPEIINIKITK